MVQRCRIEATDAQRIAEQRTSLPLSALRTVLSTHGLLALYSFSRNLLRSMPSADTVQRHSYTVASGGGDSSRDYAGGIYITTKQGH